MSKRLITPMYLFDISSKKPNEVPGYIWSLLPCGFWIGEKVCETSQQEVLETKEPIESLDTVETWKIRVPDFKLECELPLAKIQKIPMIAGSLNFAEKDKKEIILKSEVCPYELPWKYLFKYLTTGKFEIDVNLALETYMLCEYIFIEPEYMPEVFEVLSDKYPIYMFTHAGLYKWIILMRNFEKANISLENLTRLPDDEKGIDLYLEYGPTLQKVYMAHLTDLDVLDVYVKYINSISYIFTKKYIRESLLTQPMTPELLKNLNSDTELILSFLSPECIWAGGSLVNCLLDKECSYLTDIDLWVFTDAKLLDIISKIETKYRDKVYFMRNGSVISVIFDKSCGFSHPLQLIYCGTIPSRIYSLIAGFDMDYLRCFANNDTVYIYPDAHTAHITGEIRYSEKKLKSYRVEKRLDKGFKFLCQYELVQRPRNKNNYFIRDESLYPKEYIINIMKTIYKTDVYT